MFFWDQHKTITSCYEKVTGSVCEKYQLTHMEYDILMFLHNNPQHNTAAEIVKVRKSTKSHVSSSLKNLESRGLIERIQSADNKKPDDPKDLCIYVDHCNGTSALVLSCDKKEKFDQNKKYRTNIRIVLYFFFLLCYNHA